MGLYVKIVQSVQTVVEEWIHLILIVLEDLKGVDAFTRDIPPEELPLAEARFWKARFHNIKGLFQQVIWFAMSRCVQVNDATCM